MIYGFYPKQKAYKKLETVPEHYLKIKERDFETENQWHMELINAGFTYNSVHDFYYSSDGALMSDSGISIKHLLEYPGIQECNELGYELVYGRPTPAGGRYGINRAIYCKNWQTVLNKHRDTAEGEEEIQAYQNAIQEFYDGVNREISPEEVSNFLKGK